MGHLHMALKCVMLPPALQIFVSIRMAVGAGGRGAAQRTKTAEKVHKPPLELY
jgi:hypothetical protein